MSETPNRKGSPTPDNYERTFLSIFFNADSVFCGMFYIVYFSKNIFSFDISNFFLNFRSFYRFYVKFNI